METVHRNDERRRYRRHPLELPVRFRSEMLDFEGDAAFVFGEVADIGRGGLFVRSEFLEMPGTRVQVVMSPSGRDEPVELLGRVAWIAEDPPRGPGMGIAVDGGPLQQAVLDQCLSQSEA